MKTVLAMIVLGLSLSVMGADKAKEAFEKTKAKAEKGDRVEQNNLGLMYAKGEGVPKDFKEAVKWFRKAAEQGHVTAQLVLGQMFTLGKGVPEDDATAYAWCTLAAANGFADAKKNKPIFAKKMTPDQIAKAEALVKEMIAKNSILIQKK